MKKATMILLVIFFAAAISSIVWFPIIQMNIRFHNGKAVKVVEDYKYGSGDYCLVKVVKVEDNQGNQTIVYSGRVWYWDGMDEGGICDTDLFHWDADLYETEGIVYKVKVTDEYTAVFVDINGDAFVFIDEGYEVGDIIHLIMDGENTDDITDDTIVCVKH